MTPVRLEPAALRSRVKHSTTEPLRSHFYERNGKNLFWSIKNSGEILNKLKSKGFLASSLSTYDFFVLQECVIMLIFFLCVLFCCFTSQVNSHGHCGTVSSPNHRLEQAVNQ